MSGAVPLPDLRLVWLAAWVVVGLCVAWALVRTDMPWPWAALAVVGWPVLLPLVRPTEPVPDPVLAGPLAVRIAATFTALDEVLACPGAAQLDCAPELHELREALGRVDARLAVADRILADGGDELAPLRTARDRSVDECDGVLLGVRQLRVQVGLLTLAGDTAPVRARLAELQARVAALEELA